MEDTLFELYYSQVHRNEELQNDLHQATNEIKLLNNRVDNLQRNIGYLCEENIKLRDTINAYEQLF